LGIGPNPQSPIPNRIILKNNFLNGLIMKFFIFV
jgi:hypothetical protein